MSNIAVAYLAAWEKGERVRNYGKIRHEAKSTALRDTMLLLLRDVPDFEDEETADDFVNCLITAGESEEAAANSVQLLIAAQEYIDAAKETPDIPGYTADHAGVRRRLEELYERRDRYNRAEAEANPAEMAVSAALPAEPESDQKFCDEFSRAAFQIAADPNSAGHKFREAHNSAATPVPSEFSLPTGQAKPASLHSPAAETTKKVVERVGTGKNARKRQLRKVATAAVRSRGFADDLIVPPDVPY